MGSVSGTTLKRGHGPIILKDSILRYELKGKARTRPDIFRMVLGPFEASKHGPTATLACDLLIGITR